ncbi:MAG TPA: hypothetical protein VGL35_00600, partial [Rhizomicrobium sp.]
SALRDMMRAIRRDDAGDARHRATLPGNETGAEDWRLAEGTENCNTLSSKRAEATFRAFYVCCPGILFLCC